MLEAVRTDNTVSVVNAIFRSRIDLKFIRAAKARVVCVFVSPNSFVSGQSTSLIFQACRHVRYLFTSRDSYVGHRKGTLRQAQGFLLCLIA